MNKDLSNKQIITIGLMLFALFLGAGNIIFPSFLGQQAGTNVWIAVGGFLITGVGLPLLAVIAVGRVGSLQKLAGQVNPIFGIVFTIVIYLAIGPFFAIPRTATVTYEIAVLPFLSESISQSSLPLFVLSFIFFAVSAWLSLNPSKLVGRLGNIITPLLLIVLAVLVGKSILSPLGPIGNPTEAYQSNSFFNGFNEGYLTMDTFGGLAFGVVIISAVKGLGVTSQTAITKTVAKAGVIAAIGLALVYLSLTYIGATSVTEIGMMDNGGAVISAVTKALFGNIGSIILALTIFLACITTSIGLISACSHFFSEQVPALSYKTFAFIIASFSMLVSNVGLSQLISISSPVLSFIYPLAITLIIVSFFHKYFKGKSVVYVGAMISTGIVSLFDGLSAASIHLGAVSDFFASLPFSAQGVGWIIPSIIGALIGFGYSFLFDKQPESAPTTTMAD